MKTLDASAKIKTHYCIDGWLRDEQINSCLRRKGLGRIESHADRDEPIAVVCYGPSLRDTWEEIKRFKWIISCSGATKFLISRGIIPTWHTSVDPRIEQIELLGDPHPEVTYLPASCCHPAYFDHLQAAGVKIDIWHVYDNDEEAMRKLPPNEWAVTGGSNVGLRAMSLARFFGFTEQHIFGMDGSWSDEKDHKHADVHRTMDIPGHSLCEYPKGSGRMWRTTAGFLTSAQQTFHELDMMPSVKAKFYGDGLVQEMAKHYVPKAIKPNTVAIAMQKPELISAEYRQMNAQLHKENLAYGVGGGKHAKTVLKLAEAIKTHSILDYGCGKGYLAKSIPFPIWEYDPAIEGKDSPPRPANLVICADVLEHVEPILLEYVLDDLRRCTLSVGYLVIHTGASSKTLPDGRNTHLIQEGQEWWAERLGKYFRVGQITKSGPLLHVVVGPSSGKTSIKQSVPGRAVEINPVAMCPNFRHAKQAVS